MMLLPIRIELPKAQYHLISRGDPLEDIFHDLSQQMCQTEPISMTVIMTSMETIHHVIFTEVADWATVPQFAP